MPDEIEPNELRRLYWEEGFQQKEIAVFYDVDISTISTRMKEHDIPTVYIDQSQYTYRDEKLLRKLYWEKLLPTTKIAELFSVASGTINTHLRRNDIELRNQMECQYVRHNGEMPPEDYMETPEEPQTPDTPGMDSNTPPVLMTDGGPQVAALEDDEQQESADLEDGAGPRELTDDDKKAIRYVIQAWDGSEYRDLSITEIIQQTGVTRYWVRKALNRLIFEGQVQQGRTVGVSTTYERVSNDLSFMEEGDDDNDDDGGDEDQMGLDELFPPEDEDEEDVPQHAALSDD